MYVSLWTFPSSVYFQAKKVWPLSSEAVLELPTFRCICQSWWLNVCFCRISVHICQMYLLVGGTWYWEICFISERCSQRKEIMHTGMSLKSSRMENKADMRLWRNNLWVFLQFDGLQCRCIDFQWNQMCSETQNYFSWPKLSPFLIFFSLTYSVQSRAHCVSSCCRWVECTSLEREK